jgi:P-type E1-E2 ATPase
LLDSHGTGRNEQRLIAYFSMEQASGGGGGARATGSIGFVDPIRPDARVLVDKCRSRGMHVVILSGDSSPHLAWVERELGVQQAFTCLPHEKVLRIRELQVKYGPVIMVGDGANDSPALTASDVGISVDASSMASESAKVVLLSGDLTRVFDLIRLSDHVVGVATRTVFWGMTASVIQMTAAAYGSTSPFVNAVIQETVDLCATLHSLRALSFQPGS